MGRKEKRVLCWLLNRPGFQRVYAKVLFDNRLFLSSEMHLKDPFLEKSAIPNQTNTTRPHIPMIDSYYSPLFVSFLQKQHRLVQMWRTRITMMQPAKNYLGCDAPACRL